MAFNGKRKVVLLLTYNYYAWSFCCACVDNVDFHGECVMVCRTACALRSGLLAWRTAVEVSQGIAEKRSGSRSTDAGGRGKENQRPHVTHAYYDKSRGSHSSAITVFNRIRIKDKHNLK
jgi:hypothetical protein